MMGVPDQHMLGALTQGALQPSTRFRWTQHEAQLAQLGWQTQTLHARFSAYPPARKLARPLWGMAALADAAGRVRQLNDSADIVFLQRELLATLYSAERWLRRPYLFDVDDAIFLGRRGHNADRIAAGAAHIVCGNAFLADHFSRFGRVSILPTAVDIQRFTPRPRLPERPTLGWSGSSSGFAYLYSIEAALARVLEQVPDAELHIVADQAPVFRQLPPTRVRYTRWSADIEVAALHGFSVGLMPLEDSLWARGKCSFKMLTYMACELPCVVSPVGMNSEVLALGDCGVAARATDEWVDALVEMLRDEGLARRRGKAGRHIIETHFAQPVIGAQLAAALESCR
jgi:glycosyltransferase involved in cell wall biosynthesis